MAIGTRFFQGGLALVLMGLSSCSDPSNQMSDAGTGQSPPAIELPTPSPTPIPTPTAARPTSSNAESVKIYHLDLQCQNFQSETVALPKERSIELAIGQVLEAQQNSDFHLSGYRVIRRPQGEVIVDFRLAADSRRQFTSLSSCEQKALFGSIRETLLRNSQWGVKLIRFRNRGAAIVL